MKLSRCFKNFDATLDTDICTEKRNAELTITLRLALEQVNPWLFNRGRSKDSNDVRRKIVRWTDKQWKTWKYNLALAAEFHWGGKFHLINKWGYFPFKSKNGVTFFPNIHCLFKLELHDADDKCAREKCHRTIEVVRLHSSERSFGSWVGHSIGGKLSHTDIKRAAVARDSNGKKIYQTGAIHEIGHLLGFDHVLEGSSHCPANSDTNARVCYGITDIQKNDIMGAGMQLHHHHADPWLFAMSAFTQSAKPAASELFRMTEPFSHRPLGNGSWPVKMTPCPPFSVADVVSGKLRRSYGVGYVVPDIPPAPSN